MHNVIGEEDLIENIEKNQINNMPVSPKKKPKPFDSGNQQLSTRFSYNQYINGSLAQQRMSVNTEVKCLSSTTYIKQFNRNSCNNPLLSP